MAEDQLPAAEQPVNEIINNEAPTPGSFSKELLLHGLTRDQYLFCAERAIKNSGWHLVSVLKDSVIVHTQGVGDSLGESVTITIGAETVLFQSRSMNEYYPQNNQNEQNCAQYEAALDAVIQHDRELERKFRPGSNERFGALVPSATYLITPLLIYINIIVFAIMVISGVSWLAPTVPDLLRLGGNFRPSVLQGEWWRLFTHMFLHGGILHLLMNMYALLYIGMLLEPILGKFRFASAYLLSGICGGLLSLAWHANTVGVGASGAIFGMYGVFLALLTTKYIQKTMRKTMLRSIMFFVVYNLFAGMHGNIDNAAHIGGLLSGLAIGYIYYPGVNLRHDIRRQVLTTSAIFFAVVGLCVAARFTVRDDISIYVHEMQRFTDMESMALEVFKMEPNADKKDVLYNIKDRGIYYWNEDLGILHYMDQLDLPEHIRQRNKMLEEYCNLRIKQYEAMYDLVNTDAIYRKSEIEQYRVRIDRIITTLKAQ